MNDNTPNSLEPVEKVSVARVSKSPLYAVLLIVLLLFAALVYSVNFAHNNQGKDQAETTKVDIKETEKPLLTGEGRGLALPPANAPALAQPDKAPGKPEPLVVVRDNQ